MNRRGFFRSVAACAVAMLVPPLKAMGAKPRQMLICGRPVSGAWVQYHTRYTEVNKDELIAKMREALKHTTFHPPVAP